MVDTAVMSRAWVALALAHAAVDELAGTDLTSSPDDEVTAIWRDLERLRNRLAAADHALISEVQRRGLAFTLGARSTAALLRELLRVDPGEARARVRAAASAGPNATLTGESLPPTYPAIARAQARGDISPRHADVIVKTIERLPDAVQAEYGADAEATLVEHAETFDPHVLGRIAARLSAHLDQDGRLHDVAYRDQHRDLTVRQRPDGSAAVTGELTAECAERLLTALDSLARPRPEADGVKDARTAGQRRHDALAALLERGQRAGHLPDVGGVTATVILTMTDDAWRSGTGTAVTGHGALIPAAEAIHWTGGDARVIAVAMNSMREVTAYSGLHRIFTEGQRLAMNARDGGCTFPACPVPAAWTQAHHVTDWVDTGRTTIADGALVCGYHHRDCINRGWRTRMIDGRPAWVPPRWLDEEQKPRYNTLHHPPGSHG